MAWARPTEEQKRELDSFRLAEKHPAASYDDLPEEVQNYIGRIEMELYDKKQEQAAATAFFLTFIGGYSIYVAYTDQAWSQFASYIGGTVFIVFASLR